jgi:hypothetical protein
MVMAYQVDHDPFRIQNTNLGNQNSWGEIFSSILSILIVSFFNHQNYGFQILLSAPSLSKNFKKFN